MAVFGSFNFVALIVLFLGSSFGAGWLGLMSAMTGSPGQSLESPAAQVSRQLQDVGVSATVSYVHHGNPEGSVWIVNASNISLDKMDFASKAVANGRVNYAKGSGRFGYVILKKWQNGSQLLGVICTRSEAEFKQAEPNFASSFSRIAKSRF